MISPLFSYKARRIPCAEIYAVMRVKFLSVRVRSLRSEEHNRGSSFQLFSNNSLSDINFHQFFCTNAPFCLDVRLKFLTILMLIVVLIR